MTRLLRLYQSGVDMFARDGYPAAWHRCPDCLGSGWLCAATDGPCAPLVACCVDHGTCPSMNGCPTCFAPAGTGGTGSIKQLVRELAGHRCVRCGHPYRTGQHGSGEWSPCDERCTHDTTNVRVALDAVDPGDPRDVDWTVLDQSSWSGYETAGAIACRKPTQARWRILTVHHLDGVKANCRWWNLAPLCQRCHLTVQGRVQMARVWPWEHTEWMRPYAAGYYAWVYLGEDLTREQTIARLGELLALERAA